MTRQQQEHLGETTKAFAQTAALTNQPQEPMPSQDAGIALDALIDEKVFGYTWQPVTSADIAPPTCTHRLYKSPGGAGHIRAERHADGRVVVFGGREYSTEMADAWLVVAEVQRRLNESLRLVVYPYRRTYAAFTSDIDDDGYAEANGDLATPLAICRAALAAVGAA